MQYLEPQQKLVELSVKLLDIVSSEVTSSSSILVRNKELENATQAQYRSFLGRFFGAVYDTFNFQKHINSGYSYANFVVAQELNAIKAVMREATKAEKLGGKLTLPGYEEDLSLYSPEQILSLRIDSIDPEVLASELQRQNPGIYGKHTAILIQNAKSRMLEKLDAQQGIDLKQDIELQQASSMPNEQIQSQQGRDFIMQPDTRGGLLNSDASSAAVQSVSRIRDNQRRPKTELSSFAKDNMSSDVRTELNDIIRKLNGDQGTGKGQTGMEKAKDDVDTKIDIFNAWVESSKTIFVDKNNHKIDKERIYEMAQDKLYAELKDEKVGINKKNVAKRLVDPTVFSKHLAAVYQEVISQRIAEIATSHIATDREDALKIHEIESVDVPGRFVKVIALKKWQLEKLKPINVDALHQQNERQHKSIAVTAAASVKGGLGVTDVPGVGDEKILAVIDMLRDIKEKGNGEDKKKATKILDATEADPSHAYDKKAHFAFISNQEGAWLNKKIYEYAGHAYSSGGFQLGWEANFGTRTPEVEQDRLHIQSAYDQRRATFLMIRDDACQLFNPRAPLPADTEFQAFNKLLVHANDYKTLNPDDTVGIKDYNNLVNLIKTMLPRGKADIHAMVNRMNLPVNILVDQVARHAPEESGKVFGVGFPDKPPVVGQKIPGTDIKATQADVRNYHLACAIRANHDAALPGFGPTAVLDSTNLNHSKLILNKLKEVNLDTKTHLKAPKPNNQQRNRSGRGQ
jgi:hypothetical protein